MNREIKELLTVDELSCLLVIEDSEQIDYESFSPEPYLADGVAHVFVDGKPMHAFAEEHGVLSKQGKAIAFSDKSKNLFAWLSQFEDRGLKSVLVHADQDIEIGIDELRTYGEV